MPHSFRSPAALGRGRTLRAIPLAAAFALFLLSVPAHAQNPEDDPIPDDDTPAQPVSPPPAPAPAPPVEPGKTVPDQPAANTKPPGQTPPTAAPPTTQGTPSTAPVAPPAGGNPDETVTLTRGQLDQLLRQQAELQRQIDELKRANATGAGGSVGNTGSATDGTSGNGTASQGSGSGVPAPSTPAPTTSTSAPASGSNRALLLPDISFIGQAKGLYSNDKRDDMRSQFRLTEGEIGIQGYVYPGVKADAFIVGSPTEQQAFQLEETYLSFLGVRPGLNIYAGRKFAPFGRTGEQHNHSWLYSRQLLPFRDLVAAEALVGDGVNFRYTRPFGKLYTQADFGIFTGEGAGTLSTNAAGVFDPTNPFGSQVPGGSAASFTRRFINSRLYAAVPVGSNGEFALGTSYARGTSALNGLDGTEIGNGHAAIYGFDGTYRRYLPGGRRILARAEYFGYRPGQGLPTSAASGYYGLLNYRLNTTYDIGFLAERSGFPQAPGQHESALSLIFTKQFTEQFYTRLQASHGDRPGKGGFNEIFLQFVFGLGPHTHSLE